MEKEGIEAAKEAYYKWSIEQSNDFNFGPQELNSRGYKYIRNDEINKAINVFLFNIELYADNSNVYTSLAEAYMLNGDNKRAIIYYKKSLELDPCNIKSIEMLEKLNPNRLKYGIMKDERTNINNLKSLHRGIYQPA